MIFKLVKAKQKNIVVAYIYERMVKPEILFFWLLCECKSHMEKKNFGNFNIEKIYKNYYKEYVTNFWYCHFEKYLPIKMQKQYTNVCFNKYIFFYLFNLLNFRCFENRNKIEGTFLHHY